MNPKLLDVDYETLSTTIFHPSVDGETVAIEEVQDCEPIVEANKLLFNDVDERAGFKGDGLHRVASIPNVIWYELEKRGITRDQKKLRAWLNDRDNLAFRTRPGRV